MTAWVNSDGLVVQFGTDEAVLAKAGEYPDVVGSSRVVEVKVTATGLAATPTLLDEYVSIPKNARIEKVEVVTETAVTSGGSAVLNFGLRALDRTTAIDEDGIVAALPIASFNAVGETVLLTAGVTYGGALLGTTISQAGLLYADYDTAAFTTGVFTIRVFFRIL